MSIEEVPQDIRRRVAQRLESVRSGLLVKGAENAMLADTVCPIFRPDIDGVAYFEFEVIGLNAKARNGEDGSTGFIIATNGRHDIPLPHWSLQVEPPSRSLERLAEKGGIVKVVKLDTLAYAGEDKKGALVANIGQLPVALSGIPAPQKGRPVIGTMTATPGISSNDESPADLSVKTGGNLVQKVGMKPWRSWADMKRRYAKVYKPHLLALEAHAATHWNNEDLLANFGEGILEGREIVVPLLQAGKANISGDAANAVKFTVLDRKPPAVLLEALPSDVKTETDFKLELAYDDGSSETLLFFTVPSGTPSNYRSSLPDK
jgi:hypothetical protein